MIAYAPLTEAGVFKAITSRCKYFTAPEEKADGTTGTLNKPDDSAA